MTPDLGNHEGFLRWLRTAVHARTYLEIGVERGRTLLMGGTPTTLAVGVDPDYRLVAPAEVAVRVALFRKTSDAFFADGDWHRLTREPVDVTFVDGMHHCEYALRDVLNAEKLSRRDSVILVHDIVPGNAAEAARERATTLWMGDVFRAALALRRLRPDLAITCVEDIAPSGMMIVTGLDPAAAPVDLAAAEAFMMGLDYDRDFEAGMRPMLVGTRSTAFVALRRRLERLGRRRRWMRAASRR